MKILCAEGAWDFKRVVCKEVRADGGEKVSSSRSDIWIGREKWRKVHFPVSKNVYDALCILSSFYVSRPRPLHLQSLLCPGDVRSSARAYG